jgi:hypothetical protein
MKTIIIWRGLERYACIRDYVAHTRMRKWTCNWSLIVWNKKGVQAHVIHIWSAEESANFWNLYCSPNFALVLYIFSCVYMRRCERLQCSNSVPTDNLHLPIYSYRWIGI